MSSHKTHCFGLFLAYPYHFFAQSCGRWIKLTENFFSLKGVPKIYPQNIYSPCNIEGVARPLHRWSGGGGMVVVGLSSASSVTAARALACPNLRVALLNH